MEGTAMIRWILAALHLLALGIGLGAVWARGRALRGPLDTAGLRRVLYADSWWGIAAILWIGTGVARAFGGFEKGSPYYLHNHLFWAKMGLLAAILFLELSPMITLIRWRAQLGRGQQPDTTAAPRLARVSFLQAVIVILMVLAATGMARGYGVALQPPTEVRR
jgi:putative membrane protein